MAAGGGVAGVGFGFFLALILFGLALFAAPASWRPWMVIVILLAANVRSPGALSGMLGRVFR